MTSPTSKDHEASDDEVLGRQDALQAESVGILRDLDLFARLATVGAPVQTGSSVYGLMVARDIDVTTLCRALDVPTIVAAGAGLATHPRVRRLAFRNDTGPWNTDPAYPDGLYWMVEYVADSGSVWNLDLWFLRVGTTQYDLEDLETLPPRLRPALRLSILRIKEAWGDPPSGQRMRSHRIYEAVLDGGVRTPEDFARYLESE